MKRELLFSVAIVLASAPFSFPQDIAPMSTMPRSAAAPGDPPRELGRVTAALTYGTLDCNSAPPLACGVSKTVSPSCLSGAYYLDLYTITVTAGQSVTLTVTTSTGYQILVAVLDRDGNDVAKQYGASPVTLSHTFAVAGSYSVGIGYVAQYATGLYTASLTCGSSTTNDCRNLGTLAGNVTTAGSLSSSTGHCFPDDSYSAAYAMNLTQGVTTTITYVATFPPYVNAESEDHRFGVYRSSTTAGTVTFNITPGYTGRHWLYVGSLSSTPVTGSYTVRIENAAIPATTIRCRVAGH